MHALDLAAGDAVLVPAGLPHAIGEGAFVVELQEPTDLSILLEWSGFEIDGATDGHLGLGFDVALAAVDRRGWSADDISGLRGATAESTGELLPDAGAVRSGASAGRSTTRRRDHFLARLRFPRQPFRRHGHGRSTWPCAARSPSWAWSTCWAVARRT